MATCELLIGQQLGDVSELYEERPCLYNTNNEFCIHYLVLFTPFP